MKRLIILLLTSHLCLTGMQQGWENYKSDLVESLRKGVDQKTAEKRVLINKTQLDQTINNITWAVRKNGSGGKLIAVYVYEGNEDFKAAFANPNNGSYIALRDFMSALAQKRLSQASESGSLARTPASSTQQINPEVVIVSYQYGPKDTKKNNEEDKSNKARLLSDFIVSLPILYGADAKIVIVAKGESTDIVSRATHRTGLNTIDTLIYFQAPIYEWEWRGDYVYNTDVAPAGFKHLYHFYSKSGWTPHVLNPERKFKQQSRMNGINLIFPVKNTRMLKVNGSNKLEDFSENDFLNTQAIKNYYALIEQIDEYKINFDLIAKGFAERATLAPVVAINRFVVFNNNIISATYGTSAIGAEKYYTVAEISPAQSVLLKKGFAQEVRRSNEQLALIMNVPATQGWASYLSGGYVTKLELSQELKNIQQRNQAELKRIQG